MENPAAKPVFEIDTALHRVGGDTELLAETAQMFLDETPAMIADVREAVSGGDAIAVERSAHRIKGSLVTIAAPAAADAALALEQLGRAGELGTVRDALAQLEAELDRLVPCLQTIAEPGPSSR